MTLLRFAYGFRRGVIAAALSISALSIPGIGTAQAPAAHLDGDIGLAMVRDPAPSRGVSARTRLWPYLFFDYGPAFVRIDTFGLRTVPMGAGSLELVGRASRDGFDTGTPLLAGQHARRDSLPVGLGSWQETRAGVFDVNVLRDIGPSHGWTADFTWAAQFEALGLTWYPQLGLDHQDARYDDYYAGTVRTATLPAWRPGGATGRSVAMMVERAVGRDWIAGLYLRRRWLGHAVADSPLSRGSTADSAFFEISRRFR